MSQPTEQRQALTAIVFSNAGHSFSHMFIVLYATAVLHLPKAFGLPYAELLGLSSLGLVLFELAALPAGWLGDRWSQIGMMGIFFIGVGVGSIIVGMAGGPDGFYADRLVRLDLSSGRYRVDRRLGRKTGYDARHQRCLRERRQRDRTGLCWVND